MLRMRTRLRIAAAGSFLAAIGFLPIPFGYLLSGPGRGFETLFVASVLGVCLLLIAGALVAQALGFRSLPDGRPVSGAVTVAATADALALGVLGVVLLADRHPCAGGLYCSGQVVGALGRAAIYLWFPVLGIGYLVVGGLVLAERSIRKSSWFAAAATLILVDGVVLLAFLASIYNRGFSLAASLLFLLGLALGPAANAVFGCAFQASARAAAVLPQR